MAYQVLADDGTPLDAHLDVERNILIFRSRGGSKKRGAINADYSRALRLLLKRLADVGRPIERAWLDSSRVQGISVADRLIADERDRGASPDELASRMASRMQRIGRDPTSKSDHGNASKRIRLQLDAKFTHDEVVALLKLRRVKKDFRSEERLPVSELELAKPEHLFAAVQRLRRGPVPHRFRDSTKFDVLLEDGKRLPPKAVLGLALTESLGREVTPRNFAGGRGSACFRILEDAGYEIVRKGAERKVQAESIPPDPELLEGGAKLRTHFRRERASGLRKAKISQFRGKHENQLFCERCGENPVVKYKSDLADSCIEVHHAKIVVSKMNAGHVTRLEDLQCLCANCHRLAHRELRELDR